VTDFATIAYWIVNLTEAFILAFHAIRITIQRLIKRRGRPHPRCHCDIQRQATRRRRETEEQQ
jgi:hypothetical protein